MFTLRRLFASSCLLLLSLLSTVLAQSDQPGRAGPKTTTTTTVTASADAKRVRFTAPSNVVRMQLQVISESGQLLFDVNSKGNVLDWSLQDSSGQRLQGVYLTVVTVKTLAGRLSERVGSVSIGEGNVGGSQWLGLRIQHRPLVGTLHHPRVDQRGGRGASGHQ